MRILIVLNQQTEALETVQGFDWDHSYGAIQMNEGSFLYRGTLTSMDARKEIEQMPFFVSLWEDSIVGPAVVAQTESRKTKMIHMNATKKELELFLSKNSQRTYPFRGKMNGSFFYHPKSKRIRKKHIELPCV